MNIGKPNNDGKGPESIRFSVIFAIAMAEQEKRWRSIEVERIENAGITPQCQSQLTHQTKGSKPNTGSIIRMPGVMEAGASGHTRTLNRPRYQIPGIYPEVFIYTDMLGLVL